MGKRGRKPAVPWSTVLKELMKYELYENNALKRRGDDTWKNVCESLGNLIKPISLYFSFRKNYNDIRTNYIRQKGLNIVEEPKLKKRKKKLSCSTEEESDDDYNEQDSDKEPMSKRKKKLQVNQEANECMSFVIPISSDEWSRIKPTVPDDGSDDKTLQEGWSDLLIDKIYQLEKLHSTPKQRRRTKAALEMDHGDCEPPDLSNFPSLPKAAQDAQNEALGLVTESTIFQSLSSLKKSSQFNKFIRDIGYDNFFIFYWSPEQINLHNDILNYIENPMSLDATGPIPLKINRSGESLDVYLTVLSTNIKSTIVPVAQMLSEKNDTNLITYWLNEWLKSGADTPKFITMDMERALQNAVSLSFNNMTFEKYNDNCLLLLTKNNDNLKLNTQLRTDISHLIHAVAKWPCFSKCTPHKVKLLYKKFIGFMTTIKDLKSFDKCLENILILAFSEFDSPLCKDTYNFIIACIKTFNVEEDDYSSEFDDEKTNKKISSTLENNTDESLTSIYINLIKSRIDVEINKHSTNDIFKQNNDYYLPDFGLQLMKLSEQFPCWTAVMNFYFENPQEVPTSARTETYFKKTKDILLDNRKPIKTDKFLVKHMKALDSNIKLARAKFTKVVPNKNIFKNKKIGRDYLSEVERWKKKFSKVQLDNTLEFNSEEYIIESSSNAKNEKIDPKQSFQDSYLPRIVESSLLDVDPSVHHDHLYNLQLSRLSSKSEKETESKKQLANQILDINIAMQETKDVEILSADDVNNQLENIEVSIGEINDFIYINNDVIFQERWCTIGAQ